jgi:hypothetical protein
MSESTFRIVIALLCGIFLYWFIKGQIKLIESIESQSVSTIDIDSEEISKSKAELR